MRSRHPTQNPPNTISNSTTARPSPHGKINYLAEREDANALLRGGSKKKKGGAVYKKGLKMWKKGNERGKSTTKVFLF
jgi:hypothetical protein